MLRCLLFLCFFLFSLIPPFAKGYAAITHSVMPLLNRLEKTPPRKYPENYVLSLNELLAKQKYKIRVVSYNLLFNLFDDKLKDKSCSWNKRLPHIIESIENVQPDILCVQEIYPDQLESLEKALKSSFFCFVGDSKTGELNAVFYRKERFELDLTPYEFQETNLSSASLSMPFSKKDEEKVATIRGFLPPALEPGKQLTLAHFYDRLTEKKFVVINTHLTFHRINSREIQAYFIKDLVQKLHSLDKIVILGGDFNTFPNCPDDPNLPFYDGDYICQIFQTVLKETKEAALLGHIGPLASCMKNFFERKGKPFPREESPGVILDHIYVSPSTSVIINAIEPCLVNGYFPSDHLPVIADILLP